VIVGLGYVRRVGKDTAANALVRDLGFKRVGFADPLKDLAFLADPLVTSATQVVNVSAGRGHLSWVVTGVGWEEAKDKFPEVRRFLQNLGEGVCQVLGETTFIDAAMEKARLFEHTVIPDVRKIVEVDAIRSVGGVVINITRPGHEGFGHRTETELNGYDKFDHVVANDGSVVDLETRIVSLVRSIMPLALELET
jgi:hypothetical protein